MTTWWSVSNVKECQVDILIFFRIDLASLMAASALPLLRDQ